MTGKCHWQNQDPNVSASPVISKKKNEQSRHGAFTESFSLNDAAKIVVSRNADKNFHTASHCHTSDSTTCLGSRHCRNVTSSITSGLSNYSLSIVLAGFCTRPDTTSSRCDVVTSRQKVLWRHGWHVISGPAHSVSRMRAAVSVRRGAGH